MQMGPLSAWVQAENELLLNHSPIRLALQVCSEGRSPYSTEFPVCLQHSCWLSVLYRKRSEQGKNL